MKNLLLSALVSAMFVPAAVSAATIVQTFDTGVNASSSSTGLNFIHSGFDKYSGTEKLVNVTLNFNIGYRGQVLAEDCGGTLDCEPALAQVSVGGSDAFALIAESKSVSSGLTNASGDEQVGAFLVSQAGSVDFGADANFIGSGSAGYLNFQALYDGDFLQFGSTAQGVANLVYTTEAISAVPLPAALPMLLVGLGGLGVVSRRRKS